ncbi:S9 family peptidase [Alteromonas gilva]|uniref:Prolyl oligopeptidase family serine peptidase n=1 Tax=Alteromonas gilva TaxID=2987522 RepID=A0ABT5L0M6_9ALTE|nr:prolyl oligopeptidase family serine peptidase [Alteromonas gilva]MDC8829971.1 prolyl oligopeptidase family serine peptidase [Alteromonas gilva]
MRSRFRGTLLLVLFFSAVNSFAATEYQKPSEAILQLVDVKQAPYFLMNEAEDTALMLYRDAYKTIEELSEEELRLGGLRIDPKANIGSRTTFYNDIKVRRIDTNQTVDVKGLPANPRLANFTWSPDQNRMAMTHKTPEGIELWVIDLNSAAAKRLTGPVLNANMRDVINWFADNQSLLVKVVPKDRQPLINSKAATPSGPTVSVSDGKKAQNRTYQDLLKNQNDEYNFEQLTRSTLTKVTLKGTMSQWLAPAMFGDISFSPNGEFVLVTRYQKPFSYLVQYNRFPSVTSVYSSKGDLVNDIVAVPLIEDLPKGFMATRKGPRAIQWRNDKPATVVYATALDGGDPANDVEFRDEVFQLAAPFDGEPESLLKTINRFYRISWLNNNYAIAEDYWWNTRNTKTYVFNPSNNQQAPVILDDRNYQDVYSDPGSFVTERNEFGKSVLMMRNNTVYLLGDGYSDEGQFPFLDSLNLDTHDKQRIYQSPYTDKLEELDDFNADEGRLTVSIEAKNEYPNRYFRDITSDKLTQITDFENPFKAIQDVHKEVINYQREDGLELSGTLYLPVGYEEGKRYPMILWAYPREYKDQSSAGQNTNNPNEFTYPFWGSPIYWVNKGYVVLDDAAFPIVGEGEEEPNDTFRSQLVANAKAAIDAVNERGLIDPARVAVGGHSYGAFMVANLLSHSDLFAAGIARSGAYNRTLTPFGFQSEERSYWEAPEVYYTMSPFMHADKMKSPLLLIHGEADNNSGTYPMQSERYFNALKGLGATARLVMLPKESHGYRAKESILHMLWEQEQWLDTHLKAK